MKWRSDQTEWQEIDRTEVIPDNLNPNYARCFNVIFNFGQIVMLQFVVRDVDSDGTSKVIGSCEVKLSDLVKKASSKGY